MSAPAPQNVGFEGSWARRALGLYTCRDWVHARSGLRTRLLARLHRWNGGAVEGDGLVGYGSVLPDNRAAALFGNQCRGRAAQSFALYKLYGAAAAFSGVSP